MILVIDDFYENPEKVRKHGLSQDFVVSGNFPGVRTVPDYSQDLKPRLEHLLGTSVHEIVSVFQKKSEKDFSWIHNDNGCCKWVMVIYLDPKADVSSGIEFYKLFDGSLTVNPHNSKIAHKGPYETVDKIGHVYNRAILFDAKKFHMGLSGKRLSQVFFIS